VDKQTSIVTSRQNGERISMRFPGYRRFFYIYIFIYYNRWYSGYNIFTIQTKKETAKKEHIL